MGLPPLEAQKKVVDVQKLMGKWYVVAVIPNFIEKEVSMQGIEYSPCSKPFLRTSTTQSIWLVCCVKPRL